MRESTRRRSKRVSRKRIKRLIGKQTKRKCVGVGGENLGNPWYDKVMRELLKKKNKISKSQKIWWCRYINKTKKTGASCIKESDGPKKYNINTWDKVCKK